jgi:hypothetical protein
MKYSFICCLSCKTIWRCLISLQSSNLLNRWQKWVSRRSCKKWTSIFFVRCVENRSCSKLNTRFDETERSWSSKSRDWWRCKFCVLFFRHRFSNWVFRRRRCRFFVCVCCFDRFVFRRIIRDFVWDWTAHDARSSCDIFFRK